MKHIKKITAVLLALVIGFSVCALNFTSSAEETAETPQSIAEYEEVLEDAQSAITTADFVAGMKKAINAYRAVTFRGNIPKEYMTFVADDMLQQILGYIADETGVDVLLGLNSLPKTNEGIEFAVETFNIDTVALRNEIFKIRYKLDDMNMGPLASVMYYLGMYLSIIEECKVYCVPYDGMNEDNWYEIHLQIKVSDGAVEDIASGIIINPETGIVRGRNDDGMMGIGYNYSIYESLVFTPVHVWMRNYGFNLFYDIFSYTTPFFFYNTRRIKFDYAGREWMIQVWKGNYLVSNGAEVGIYNRDKIRFGTSYDCAGDEDMMNMSMKLYHGDDLIFERPEQLHWWLTGFKLSRTLYIPNTMTLDFTIEMKDEEMLKAFCNSIDKSYKDMTYTVDGLKVNVIW